REFVRVDIYCGSKSQLEVTHALIVVEIGGSQPQGKTTGKVHPLAGVAGTPTHTFGTFGGGSVGPAAGSEKRQRRLERDADRANWQSKYWRQGRAGCLDLQRNVSRADTGGEPGGHHEYHNRQQAAAQH